MNENVYAEIILEQIEKIDKKLKKSLKKKPEGFGSVTVSFDSKDMLDKVEEHYKILGYKTEKESQLNYFGTRYHYYLTISIEGWK